LEKIKWAPYRPPYDMSTLFTPDGQTVISAIQVAVGVVAAICAAVGAYRLLTVRR
jgi:hypothetical protein